MNPVELSAISNEPVERVCFGNEYLSVRDVADRYGLRMAYDRDISIPESSYGVYIVSPRRDVLYGALHRDVFVPESTRWCAMGERLAIQFETTNPLTGGRIVDLAAPDLRPTWIEAL